jgi:pimeloyl-ACP methyl ester carboxylesterase
MSDFQFANLAVASTNAANLAAFDTLVLNQVLVGQLTPQQKADINAFVENGSKLIVYDSDATSGNDYTWLVRPFTTAPACPNCGLIGGTLSIVEDDTLGSRVAASPNFVNTAEIPPSTDAIGDANVMATSDPNWFGHMRATNQRNQTGWMRAYAESPSGKGLLIYNGEDTDFIGSSGYAASGIDWLGKMWYLELKQQWDPSGLPGTTPIAGQIALSPLSASAVVGQRQTLNATVLDPIGNLAPGVTLLFTVTGVNPTTGSATSGANGIATFGYTGKTVGRDTVVATGTLNSRALTSNNARVDWTPPPRSLIFVHGINQNAAEVQASVSGQAGTKDASFKALFDSFGDDNIAVFRYYQDKAYRQGNTCPGMPAADTQTGNLFVDSNAISSTICDSKSALAYDATKLDDDLAAEQAINKSPTTVFAYSMGGAVTRGWLVLAQNRQSSNLKSVDSVIMFQGAQQGSVFGVIGRGALNGLGSVPLIGNLLVRAASSLAASLDFDPNRPAIVDLTPRSPWYGSVNPVAVPQGLHYYNVYTDIQVRVHVQFFGDTIPLGGPASFGDLVMLPGDPNPAAQPNLGGARFLPNGAARDRHEWTVARSFDFDAGDLLNDPTPAIQAVLSDPAQHLNLNANLDTGAVLVQSCQNGNGQVRPLVELLRILNDPSATCS